MSALCDRLARDDLIEDDDNAADETGEPEGDEADKDEAKPDNRVGRVYDVEVEFSALGLIENGTKRCPGSDTSTYWRLTGRRQRQLLRLRTIRKPMLVVTGRGAFEGATVAE